jgi:CRISPR-associated endoribonuclease Cas6
MPSRWEITLPTVTPGTVRLEHLHAVVSTWLDEPGTHHAHTKPYSVSPPRDGDHGPVIEVGLLDDRLADRLLSRAAPGVRVRLGRTVLTLSRPPRQIAGSGWAALAERRTTRSWCLRFATPLTFRRGNKFTPLPAPRPLLGSLRQAWSAHAPADLEPIILDLAQDPVWVTDIAGSNEVSKVNGRIVSGFVGRLRLESDADPLTTAAIDRVLRLAPYSGVGAYTTRGFGVTRLERTW